MLLKVPLTGLYAALCALIVLALALRGIGDGGDRRLARAIRVHGNAVEYVPLALILMLVVELGGAGHALVHGCGIALVAARLAHAFGLARSAGASPGRLIGTTVTFAVIAVLAATALVLYLR
jgi:uncharacterized membrane protein YecN with MAPEG domain